MLFFLFLLYQVPFYQEDNQRFGFDQQDYDIHQAHYDQIDDIAGEPYSVSWKSVRIGQTDKVNAKEKNSGGIVPDIIFTDGTETEGVPNEIGSAIALTTPSGHQQLTIEGQSSHGAIQEIFAVQKKEATAEHDHSDPPDGIADEPHVHIAGKLNVISYQAQTLNVAVVPVGDVSMPDATALSMALSKIYMQAGVDVNVSTINGFEADSPNPFPDEESGILSAYPAEMNTIINAFQDFPNANIDSETYYLFVLPSSHAAGTIGFMPKKRQFGFIFSQGLSSDVLIKTMAHELGHGAYRLKHTFESYPENPQLGDGERTANLMDYGDGTVLRKYQWDLIHNPESNFTLFDSDSEEENQLVIHLPCKMPENGYLLTSNINEIILPNEGGTEVDISNVRGIYALKDTPIEFYPKTFTDYDNTGYDKYKGAVYRIQKEENGHAKTFKARYLGGSGFHYRIESEYYDSEYYQLPTVNGLNYYQGVIEASADGNSCNCIIFPVSTTQLPVAVTIDGNPDNTEDPNYVSPNNILFPPENIDISSVIVQPVNEDFCNIESPENEGVSRINLSDSNELIEGIYGDNPILSDEDYENLPSPEHGIAANTLYDATGLVEDIDVNALLAEFNEVTFGAASGQDVTYHVYLTSDKAFNKNETLKSYFDNIETNLGADPTVTIVQVHFKEDGFSILVHGNGLESVLSTRGGIPKYESAIDQAILKKYGGSGCDSNFACSIGKAGLFFVAKAMKFGCEWLINTTNENLIIPSKYYDPGAANYDSKYADYFSFLVFVATSFPPIQLAAVLSGQDLTTFNEVAGQVLFAYICGVWNQIITEGQSIAKIGLLMSEIILDESKRDAFLEAIMNISFADIVGGIMPDFNSMPSGSITMRAYALGQNTVILGVFLFENISTVTGLAAIGQVLKGVAKSTSMKITGLLRRTAGNLGDRVKHIRGIPPEVPNGPFKICGKGGRIASLLDPLLPKDLQDEIYLKETELANLWTDGNHTAYVWLPSLNGHNNAMDVCMPTSMEIKPYFLRLNCALGTSLGSFKEMPNGDPAFVLDREELQRILSPSEVSDSPDLTYTPVKHAPSPTPNTPDIEPEIRIVDWDGVEKTPEDALGIVLKARNLKYAQGAIQTQLSSEVELEEEEEDCECDLSSDNPFKNPYDVLREEENTLLGINIMTKNDWKILCSSDVCSQSTFSAEDRDAIAQAINNLNGFAKRLAFFEDLIETSSHIAPNDLTGNNLGILADDIVDAWEIYYDADRPKLSPNIRKLQTLVDILDTESLQNTGFNAVSLTKIAREIKRYWTSTPIRAIIDNELFVNLNTLGIKIDDGNYGTFKQVFKLREGLEGMQSNNNYTATIKGANFVIKTLANNLVPNNDEFTFEAPINNIWNNTSFIDVLTELSTGLKIAAEFKSGYHSINNEIIFRELVRRDLYAWSEGELSGFVWRVEDAPAYIVKDDVARGLYDWVSQLHVYNVDSEGEVTNARIGIDSENYNRIINELKDAYPSIDVSSKENFISTFIGTNTATGGGVNISPSSSFNNFFNNVFVVH